MDSESPTRCRIAVRRATAPRTGPASRCWRTDAPHRRRRVPHRPDRHADRVHPHLRRARRTRDRVRPRRSSTHAVTSARRSRSRRDGELLVRAGVPPRPPLRRAQPTRSLATPYQNSVDSAERVDVDPLVVAVEALPERLERHVRREQRGAVGDRAPLAVEAGVGATDHDAGQQVGAGVGDLGARRRARPTTGCRWPSGWPPTPAACSRRRASGGRRARQRGGPRPRRASRRASVRMSTSMSTTSGMVLVF